MHTIEFGKYYKDETCQKQRIEWLVLDEDEETIFVVSKKAITSRCFDKEYRLWDESNIRHWLNTEFYNEAFNSYEKCCIRPTNIETTDWYDTGHMQTRDDIFLLSIVEVEKYFPKQDSRILDKSDFTRLNLDEKNEDTDTTWWLRDKGACDTTAIIVVEDGSFYEYAGAQNICGIRPAMRIIKNYSDFVRQETPIIEGQITFWDETNSNYDKK